MLRAESRFLDGTMTHRLLRELARWIAAGGARISWLATLPLQPRRRSSITDNGWWSKFCARQAADDRRFARFRRAFRHRLIVEATPPAEARQHLARVLRQTPHYQALFDKFLTLDRLGAPRMTEFAKDVWFAPNTVRYMRYLSDCETRFGNLDGATIVEIGIGFGGQCKIFFDRFAIGKYILIDLPGPIALARRVLTQLLGPETVAQRLLFLEAGNAGAPAGLPEGRFDLAISTLAFSECHRSIQQGYLNTVLSRARCGYIHRNEISGFFGLRSLRLAEIEAALPVKLDVEKDDITYWYDRNDILSWDSRCEAVAA
jgi:putative sugar O-methyltransferase